MVSAGECPAEGVGAGIQPALLARAVCPGEDLCLPRGRGMIF